MEDMKETTEQKVAREILQKPEEITVGGRTYSVPPPSVATLILASEAASRLPRLELGKDDIVTGSLRTARECRGTGDILAVLILGAKRIREEREARRSGLGRLFRRLSGRPRPDCVEELSERLLEELSPHAAQSLLARLLARMELADFFALTTFLQEASLTRPTKVGSGTTASGR